MIIQKRLAMPAFLYFYLLPLICRSLNSSTITSGANDNPATHSHCVPFKIAVLNRPWNGGISSTHNIIAKEASVARMNLLFSPTALENTLCLTLRTLKACTSWLSASTANAMVRATSMLPDSIPMRNAVNDSNPIIIPW